MRLLVIRLGVASLCFAGCRTPADTGIRPDTSGPSGESSSDATPSSLAVTESATSGAPIFSWQNSLDTGIIDALPTARWSVPYQWLERESAAEIWSRGRDDARPLQENPVGLRAIRPWFNYVVPGRKSGGRRPDEPRWRFRDELILNPGTPRQRSLGFVAPWFDEWRNVARDRQSALAADMAAAGGEVDYLILDWEQYNSFYDIKVDIEELGVSMNDYRSAVIQDARWPALREALNAAAVAAGYNPADVNFNDNLADFPDGWNNGHSPKAWVWGRYMHTQILATLDHVLFDPWTEHYPALKASDYQKYISGPWPEYTHTTWSVDGPTVPIDFGSETQWIFGTHQAPEGYGTTGSAESRPIQIHVAPANNPSRLPMVRWNPPDGVGDRFAALIKVLRKLRGAVVNQDSLGNPPLMMWVSGDQYARSVWVPAGGAPDYSWYAEAIFHYGLHNVEAWLFWNTFRLTDGSSERRLEQITHEVESLIGPAATARSRRVITNETVSWDEDRFLLSGLDTGGHRVFRFTPGEAGSVVSADPFVYQFHADGVEVEPVPGGALKRIPRTISEIGFWIVAPSGQ